MPNTIRLHRVLATSPEKIYRAFIEGDALAKWLPPNGFACTVHHLQAKVGGTFKMSFRNFTTGKSHEFGGEYVELIPGVLSALAPGGGYQSLWGTLLLVLGGMSRDAVSGVSINGHQASV